MSISRLALKLHCVPKFESDAGTLVTRSEASALTFSANWAKGDVLQRSRLMNQILSLICGPIAQLVEPPAHNRSVPGSNPGGPISYETFEKCSILFKFKEGENFKCRNTLSISRLKILGLTPTRSEALALFGQKGAFCKGLIVAWL